jgi:hypothetical protein
VADGSVGGAELPVDATVTEDEGLARASADAGAKGQAAKAQAAAIQKEAADLERKGDRVSARLERVRSRRVLTETSARYAIPELAAAAQELEAIEQMDTNMAAKASSSASRDLGRK